MSLLALLACKQEPVGQETAAPEPYELCSVHGCVELQDGLLTLRDAEGATVIVGGEGLAMVDGAPYSTSGGELDSGLTEHETELVTLSWDVSKLGDGWRVQLTVTNDSDAAVTVEKLAPLRVEGEDRGFFLGADPARHLILENGSFGALDFVVEMKDGDVPEEEALAALAPGSYRGASVSNWSHAVVDRDSDVAWVAGALTFERSLPVVGLSYESLGAPEDAGRWGFRYLSLEGDYLPSGKVLQPGESLSSEPFWFDLPPDPVLGLEELGQHIGDALEKDLWHHRAGKRVPNGWNSWSGSSSTGGYGTGIDHDLVVENMEVLRSELQGFGFDWFQVDDGYEPFYGDWTWREDRFPEGAAGLSQDIRDAGFTPGVWIAPFTADAESELVAAHPDWFADKTTLGELFASGYEILDLTHPEVLAWLEALGSEIRHDWGFDWVKIDFGYYALFGEDFAQDMTREKAWDTAFSAFRRGFGDDGFVMLIGPVGLNLRHADTVRTTLDNFPVWDWDPQLDADDLLEQQGFKPTVRTAGRRWFLHDRAVIQHPDLVFFRSNTQDESWPRVTHEEARAFASWVGLSGGIVKIGDRIVDLSPEAISVLRTLVPIDGRGARPLDLFEREFPEIWELELDGGQDGLEESWTVVGLFHWGWNVDLDDRSELSDTDPRTYEVEVEGEVLAWEFWTEELLGRVSGSLEVEVPAHDARVVALRPYTGVPQFLGWNRQITMGGTVMEEASYADGELRLVFDAAQGSEAVPFEHRLFVFLPDGYQVSGVDGAEWSVEGEVLTLVVGAEASGVTTVEVRF